MRKLLLGMYFVLMAVAAQAVTMVWNVAYLELAPSYQWSSLMAVAQVGDDMRGVGVGYKSMSYPNQVILHGYDHENAGESMSWRVMNIGDEVSRNTMMGNDKEYFYSNWINDRTGVPVNDYYIVIGVGESVYLAFFNFSSDDWFPDLFGWMELKYDGTALQVGQSAMDWDGGPVVIRPRAVPEPCAAALILVGVCVCALRRKVLRL